MSLPGFSFQGRPERPGHARNVPQETDPVKQFGVTYIACRENNTESAMREVLRTMRCRNAGAFRIIKIDKREKEITR